MCDYASHSTWLSQPIIGVNKITHKDPQYLEESIDINSVEK